MRRSQRPHDRGGIDRPLIDTDRGAARRNAENLAVTRPGARGRRVRHFEEQREAAFTEHEALTLGIERARGRDSRGHHSKAIVDAEEDLEHRVDASGGERARPAKTDRVDGGHDRAESRALLLADRDVGPAQLELQPGQARRRVTDGAVEQERGCTGRAAFVQGRQILAGRLTARRERAHHDTCTIVAGVRERVLRVLECHPRDDHRVTGRVVHAAQLHRRNPLRRLEACHRCGNRGAALRDVKRANRRNARAAGEQSFAKCFACRAERRHDADTADRDRS